MNTSSLPAGVRVLRAVYSGDRTTFPSSYAAIEPSSVINTITNQIETPSSVAVDAAQDILVTAGSYVYEIAASTKAITVVAGNGTSGYSGDGGPATAAELDNPSGVVVDANGNVYIADEWNSCVREVNRSTGVITTVVGDGTEGYSGDGGLATAAELDYPSGLALDSAGNLFIADAYNYCIREVNRSTGLITTVAGNGNGGYSGDGGPATAAELGPLGGLAVDAAGNLFIGDTSQGCVREINRSTGIVTTVAGTGALGYAGDGGPATAAKLYSPDGLAVDSADDLFIADSENHVVREVTYATGVISTIVGNGNTGDSGDGGKATWAELTLPFGLAMNAVGDLLITDESCVRNVFAGVGIGVYKATPTVAVTDIGGIRHGSAFPATATVAGTSGGAAANLEGIGLTLTYYSGTQANGSGSPTAPSVVGTYAVVASFAGMPIMPQPRAHR